MSGRFGKYRRHGAYHWDWADPGSRRYAPASQARYELVAEQLDGAETVLDVGCGDGFLSGLVARRGGWVVGLDPEPSGIRLAKGKLADTRNCRLLVGTGARLPFPDGCFEAVALAEVIEHLEDPHPTLREIRRVLRPGGRVVVTTPRRLPDRWWDRTHHVTEFASDELRSLLDVHFSGVRVTHFLPLRWWTLRKRLGKGFIRFWARNLYNPFRTTGTDPEGFGHLLAVGRTGTET